MIGLISRAVLPPLLVAFFVVATPCAVVVALPCLCIVGAVLLVLTKLPVYLVRMMFYYAPIVLIAFPLHCVEELKEVMFDTSDGLRQKCRDLLM